MLTCGGRTYGVSYFQAFVSVSNLGSLTELSENKPLHELSTIPKWL